MLLNFFVTLFFTGRAGAEGTPIYESDGSLVGGPLFLFLVLQFFLFLASEVDLLEYDDEN